MGGQKHEVVHSIVEKVVEYRPWDQQVQVMSKRMPQSVAVRGQYLHTRIRCQSLIHLRQPPDCTNRSIACEAATKSVARRTSGSGISR